MNGLVPVLIAVLLAEFGPRAAVYAGSSWRSAAPWLIAASIATASVAGGLIAPSMTEWADALLIAIALGFAAIGQVQRVKPVSGMFRTIITFWQGGAPLLAFAFATRFGAPVVALGAVGGLIAVAVLTRVASEAPVKPIRWAAAAILAVAAMVVAIGALRLA